jgi:ABC-type transport system substrate-binding protein
MLQMRIYGSHKFDLVYKELYSPALFHLSYAKILPRHHFTREVWTQQAIEKGRGPARADDSDFNYRRALPARELRFTMYPIGTGPLKIHPLNGDALPTWRSGELVRLERFDDYWNEVDLPRFKYLDMYVIEATLGAETAEINFRAGGMDIYAIRAFQVEDYEASRDRYYVYKKPDLTYEYFAFNMQHAILKDKKVRQALTLSVDQEAMIRAVFYGQARRINGPAYPMLPYYPNFPNPGADGYSDPERVDVRGYIPDYTYRQGPHAGKSLRQVFEEEWQRQQALPESERDYLALAALTYMPFDMAEAAALFDEAGWRLNSRGKRERDGQELTLKLTNGAISTSSRGKLCALATEQWNKLGVTINIDEVDFNVFVQERVMQRDFELIVLGWNGGIDYDKRKLWSSDQVPRAGYNFTSLASKEADELFETMLREYDQAEIIRMSHKAFQIIADEQPYIFLVSPYRNVAVDRHIVWDKPVRGPDGKLTHETRSLLDGGQMDIPYGPRTYRMQHRRAEEILFPPTPDERVVGGEPTRHRDIFPPSGAASGEGK